MSDDFNSDFTNTEVVPGAIAAVASFFVCLTFFTFSELRCLRYVELVYYVAVNDMIASIGISLGNTKNGSAACWFQGIATNFNYLSAILWTTVITYQVWLVVCRKSVIKDLTFAHCICWGIPFVVTLLPLSTNTYANPDDDSGWCFVATRSNSPHWSELFWFVVAFYGWIWLAMVFNIFFIVTILYRIYQMKEVPAKVNATIRKLFLYPIIITICWTPVAVWDLCTQVSNYPDSKSWEAFDSFCTIMAIAQGFLFACVFFGMNHTVRDCWFDLLSAMGCCVCCTWVKNNALLKDDRSVISMVSVSINGTSSSGGEEGNNKRATDATNENTPNTGTGRSSGGLGMLGASSFTSTGSWYSGPQPSSTAKFQDEVDFIPAGDVRLSQRLSIVDFLNNGSSQGGGALSRLSGFFDQSKSGAATTGSMSVNANPMMSMAVDDFASVSEMQSTGTGTATMSVRRAQQEGEGFDEESGITSVTGASAMPPGVRPPSESSVGTLSTYGTQNTHGTQLTQGTQATEQTGKSKRSTTSGAKRMSVSFAP